MTKEELGKEFPDKVEAVEKDLAPHYPAEMNPNFKKGTGGLISKFRSFRSPNQAEIPEGSVTDTVIKNISNQSKLESFVKKVSTSAGQKAAESAGIDWKAVLEYFGKNIKG